jgi:hypothetical protein
MGEKVEPRREVIQKHALEVKDIDYHGAEGEYEHAKRDRTKPNPAILIQA